MARRKTIKTNTFNVVTVFTDIIRDGDTLHSVEEAYEKNKKGVDAAAEIFGITPIQCVLLSVITEQTACGGHCTMSDLASFFHTYNMAIIKYAGELDSLVDKGYLWARYYCGVEGGTRFYVTTDTLHAIKDNKAVTPEKLDGLTANTLIEKIWGAYELFGNAMKTKMGVKNFVDILLTKNHTLPVVERVDEVCKDIQSEDLLEGKVLLWICICMYVHDGETAFSVDKLSALCEDRDYNMQALMEGDHPLQQEGILEFVDNDGIVDNTAVKLSSRILQGVLDDASITLRAKNKTIKYASRNLIHCDDITPHQLFYDKEVSVQVEKLSALLEEENYKNIRERIREKGFRCGFPCLFHGYPGTGKTETVLQIAKSTGRHIFKVEYSELKSRWVGESEKAIKQLFNRYRSLVESSEKTPILLFNEADAIIGKRMDGATHAVDKMENTLQNIILEEMETLDGILIATTNLVGNMDMAFERRFLYKIRFEKPSPEVAANIWREKFPSLSEHDAISLAKGYDFSGGQIENVARKFLIDSVLYGEQTASYDLLSPCCNEERLEHAKGTKIGFMR